MNSLSVVVLLVAVAAAQAGVFAGVGAPIDSAAVVAGPSGTVVRSGVAAVAAPVVAHAAHLGYAAAPLAYAAAPVVHGHYAAPLAYAVPAGSGLEGQYVHDFTEKLYDDGSYKPHIYGF